MLGARDVVVARTIFEVALLENHTHSEVALTSAPSESPHSAQTLLVRMRSTCMKVLWSSTVVSLHFVPRSYSSVLK